MNVGLNLYPICSRAKIKIKIINYSTGGNKKYPVKLFDFYSDMIIILYLQNNSDVNKTLFVKKVFFHF